MDIVEIEIVKWADYNPRTDRKKHSWFRLENDIATEPKFHKLTCAQRFIAVCLFAEVSKHHGEPTQIDVEWLADSLKIRPKEIHETIRHLADRGVVRLPNGNQLVTDGDQAVSTGVPTYERTNVRTNNNGDCDPKVTIADLVAVYKLYPRKEGKTEGLQRARNQIKTPEDLASFRLAVERYRDKVRREGTETKYIKQFSSFVTAGKWRDYLDPEVGKAADSKPLPKRDYGEMAKQLWDWISADQDAALDEELEIAVNRIGFGNLDGLSRDEFRTSGRVPGMIKQALEGVG